MFAGDLKKDDIFTVVDNIDSEGPARICLANNKAEGLRFGFPNKPGFWCYMGEKCEVELVTK